MSLSCLSFCLFLVVYHGYTNIDIDLWLNIFPTSKQPNTDIKMCVIIKIVHFNQPECIMGLNLTAKKKKK